MFAFQYAEITVRNSSLEHVTRVEVRYAETDAMGVVHHAVYPVWFELARIDFLRTHGLPFTELEAQGWQSPVVSLGLDYLRPCRFGDFIDVGSRLSLDGLRFRFDYEVVKNGDLLARGHSVHVFTRDGKPCRLPSHFIKQFFPELTDTHTNVC